MRVLVGWGEHELHVSRGGFSVAVATGDSAAVPVAVASGRPGAAVPSRSLLCSSAVLC